MTRMLTALAALALTPLLVAQDSSDEFIRITPEELEWTVRPGGSEFVYLHGDSQSEGLYVMRNKFPPGAFSAPHYHDQDRFITVISGVWYTGTDASGDREDTVPLGPGSYMMHPAGAVHYDGAIEEEVIVEIRGMGPVQTIFREE
ncbi:MAG: cupin domain-containing protein [Proteobacteria bacterium]|nr:cupin domain-containing protein [Pseudomonadota bacterium]